MGELGNHLSFVKYGLMLLGLMLGVVVVVGVVIGGGLILGDALGNPLVGYIFAFMGCIWLSWASRRFFS